jgi:hypothetical protein
MKNNGWLPMLPKANPQTNTGQYSVHLPFAVTNNQNNKSKKLHSTFFTGVGIGIFSGLSHSPNGCLA